MQSIKFIIPHFSPYRDDVIEKLANNKVGINVDVYMYGLYTEHLEWGLSNKLKVNRVGVFELFIMFLFTKSNSTVFFVPGWRFFWLFCSLVAKIKGNRVVCCTDTKKTSFVSIKKYIYHYLFYGFFVSGEASSNYLSKIFKNKILTKGVYCLNQDSIDIIYANKPSFNKKPRPVANNFRFVSVANFLPSRNQESFLKKMDLILKENNKITIVFIGKGYPNSFVEMTKSLRSIDVLFQNPIEFNKIPVVLKEYDGVIHPGNEPYSTFLIVAALLNCLIFSDDTVGSYSCLTRSNYKNIFLMSDLYDIVRGRKKITRSFDLYIPPKYLTDPQYVATSLVKNYLKN